MLTLVPDAPKPPRPINLHPGESPTTSPHVQWFLKKYLQSSNDIPLLNHIQSLAIQLLQSLNTPNPSTPMSPSPFASQETLTSNKLPLQGAQNLPLHVGFITPPFRDSKIPITDHLHAHAYVGTPDLAGWWRGMAYGSLAWYSVQDLIAEIRYVYFSPWHAVTLSKAIENRRQTTA